MSKIIFISGVSGSGKSTIGEMLAKTLQIPFFDGDDYHPKENLHKMSTGKPLNDKDRHHWLLKINELSKIHIKQKGCVIACSALKKNIANCYQKTLLMK